MNGFGGAMMRGLLLGGLIGLLMGQGFGGLAGMLGLLLQVLLIGGAIYLVVRLMRGSQANQRPVPAGMPRSVVNPREEQPQQQSTYFSGTGAGVGAGAAAASTGEDFVLEQSDLETFQQRLTEVQEAYGREDFAALRQLATPEMVSFFSEELADNATKGLRNDVRDVELLQADIAESWREGERDYATAAMRYSSVDVMRDRSTDAIVEGEDMSSETTELWTFVRPRGGVWTLSAIQQA
ncbi:hypothetical protein GCM10010136_21430 [Limoniibacter endophyticus]|uniref:Tim44-like domain-containing protein n=2 Tax=Limoniibacter endophyticus TaxID=1565040 RepID=A0A8J3DSV2_9HYPH|nr:hypothetical protein GCM10010136_21430 [Limoniibacter endophyticus]